MNSSQAPSAPLSFRYAVLLGFIGVLGFHLAYLSSDFSAAILLFLYALASFAALPSGRASFYAGFLTGLAVYAPQLGFFWSIFGPPAVTLWAVLAFWVGFFVLIAHHTRRQFSRILAAMVMPLLWMGFEYFRSELYFLRFGWLSPGLALAGDPGAPNFAAVGVYGMGFGLMVIATLLAFLPKRRAAIAGLTAIAVIALLEHMPAHMSRSRGLGTNVVVAGVQVEFPVELEVPGLLDKALSECPSAQLLMLSEYTFDGPVPTRVRNWCKKNGRYLVAGGKDVLSPTDYYNTAFVIGPSGDVVFQQAKSVPIQFFKDGFPAKQRRVWESPWGRLGICICYDLSYTRVTDDLIRQGAQALLVPTMDVADWGEHQHKLHARIAPMRAAEYGVPIFRIASSGISQIVSESGTASGTVPFGQQGAVISGNLKLGTPGRLPWDRYVAPFAAGFAGVLSCWLLVRSRKPFRENFDEGMNRTQRAKEGVLRSGV